MVIVVYVLTPLWFTYFLEWPTCSPEGHRLHSDGKGQPEDKEQSFLAELVKARQTT